MKVTIELTEAEVKGLKSYLQEVTGESKITKADIVQEIKGIVSCSFQTGAISDHIKY